MTTFTQGYDIVGEELRMLHINWPIYFHGLSWPLGATSIRVALGDAQVMSVVQEWSWRYRRYDQGIAWENQPVNETLEQRMNDRLTYWSNSWDARKVRELHDMAYEGFRHPTEEECQAAEARASPRGRAFGSLMD